MATFLVQFVAQQFRTWKISFDFTWKVILTAVYHEFISVIFSKLSLRSRSYTSLGVRLDPQ
jgi:hypothetical protein